MTGDNFYTYNYGPSWWQILVIAFTAAAAVVVLDRLWEHAVDAWFDWRERRRDDPIEDASDLPEPDPDFPDSGRAENDRRFVPSVPRTVLSEDGTTETPYDPQAEKELT